MNNLAVFGFAIATTLALTGIGFLGSMVIGGLIAVFRVSPIKPLQIFGGIYVEIFRNMPMLCLLMIMVFGLPDMGITLPLFWCAAITMMLLGGSFAAEALRSGINSVSVGNAEAARAIGLSFSQSLRYVILPQAATAMVQPLVTVLIGQLMGSSLAATISVHELTYETQLYNLNNAGGLTIFAIASVFYITVSLSFGWLGARLENKIRMAR